MVPPLALPTPPRKGKHANDEESDDDGDKGDGDRGHGGIESAQFDTEDLPECGLNMLVLVETADITRHLYGPPREEILCFSSLPLPIWDLSRM